MTQHNRPISKKQNNQMMLLEIFLLILFTAAVAVLGILLYKNVGKKQIKQNEEITKDSSSVLEVIPEDAADTDMLAQHFTYVSLDDSYKGSGTVYLSEEISKPGRGDLQPVYNAVFNKKGLQIASVKDSKMTCRNEMVIPLTDMLNDFYDETGLRTIMIEKAYSSQNKTQQESNNAEEYEETGDGGFYDPDGNYITFGYTDEDGVFHDDGYYDSYGNYMGYGYYDSDGNYTPYEEMALSAQDVQTVNDTKKKQEEPACGEHEDGYSLDLAVYNKDSGKTTAFDNSGDYGWFEENSWRYGFILRFPEGKEDITGYGYVPGHFRYVGRTAAKMIHDNGLTLEELSSFVSAYNYDSPLTVNSLDGTAVCYSIEYSGLETTDIQVPADSEGNALPYTVSDTGDGRYIITVILPEEYVIKNGKTEAEDAAADTDSTDQATGSAE